MFRFSLVAIRLPEKTRQNCVIVNSGNLSRPQTRSAYPRSRLYPSLSSPTLPSDSKNAVGQGRTASECHPERGVDVSEMSHPSSHNQCYRNSLSDSHFPRRGTRECRPASSSSQRGYLEEFCFFVLYPENATSGKMLLGVPPPLRSAVPHHLTLKSWRFLII